MHEQNFIFTIDYPFFIFGKGGGDSRTALCLFIFCQCAGKILLAYDIYKGRKKPRLPRRLLGK